MTHQNVRLGMCWKLFSATLNKLEEPEYLWYKKRYLIRVSCIFSSHTVYLFMFQNGLDRKGEIFECIYKYHYSFFVHKKLSSTSSFYSYFLGTIRGTL